MRQVFIQQAQATPSQRIAQGFNPYQVWMSVLRLSPFTIAMRMDLTGYVDRMSWPDAIERPRAIRFLSQVCAGEFKVDADFVTRFCQAIKQTPDVLVDRSSRAPAPPEIVEAAMKRVERFAFGDQSVPPGLWNFLTNEIHKGERAGDQHWDGAEVTFGDMFAYMEGLYNDLYTQPGLARESELFPENPSSRVVTIASLRSRYQDIVSYYADHLLSTVETNEMERGGLETYLAWRESPQMREFLKSRSNMVYLRTQLEKIGQADGLPQSSLRMQP